MRSLLLLLLVVILTLNNFSVIAQAPSYVPSNGLIGWWPFNGNSIDESGHANNASLSNTGYPLPLTADRNNNINSAYTFSSPHVLNGVYLTIGNPASVANFGVGSYTISLWFRTAANFGVNTNLPMLYYGANGTINTSWYLGAYVNSLLSGATSGSYNYVVSSINAVADTSWHNAVWLRNVGKNEYQLYLDGVKLSSNNYGAFIENIIGSGNSQLYVGANPYGNPFYGDIDDIGIWHRALDSSEIVGLFMANSDVGLTQFSNNALSIFPIPTSEKLMVENVVKPCQAEITNLLGQTLISITLDSGNNIIDVSALSNGFYLFNCNMQVKKFLISKN